MVAAGEAELDVEFGGSDDSDGAEAGNETGTENESGTESETDTEGELGAVLEGSLAPGENATVVVTDGGGEAVEDATVAVDGELTFAVPEDVSLDAEVTVTADGETVTLDSTTAAAAN